MTERARTPRALPGAGDPFLPRAVEQEFASVWAALAAAAPSLLGGKSRINLAINTTGFLSVTDEVTTTEADHLWRVPTAFTLEDFHVRVEAAVGAGDTITFTVRKNQVDTAVTVQLGVGATEGADTTNTATFAAGDKLSVKVVTTGTAASQPGWSAVLAA